ncbi:MAG: endo-1,4-beta-xylanase [Lentisphaeria bacterium]|jgi:hypothetical protein
MRMNRNRGQMLKTAVLTLGLLLAGRGLPAAELSPEDDASPWGMCSSGESFRDYPKFNPPLAKAGVKWIRMFPEWSGIQPKKGEWQWETADALVANAKANNLHLSGGWCYFAPWASATGDTRTGPIKDIQFWKDYVGATVERYRHDIKYWEVWNEFNGTFYSGRTWEQKVKDYAALTVAAYDATKKADPSVKVGIGVANFDVAFLDAAIKAGAAGHFDFVCVHPYENLVAAMDNGEAGYLSMAGSLRKMLADNQQRPDIQLWITEIGGEGGATAKVEPEKEARQAEMLAKAYLLSLAQGFSKIYWFEARYPADPFSIIRADWTPRPAYDTYQAMTRLLGVAPHSVGWLKVGADGSGYGFMFQGANGPVLTAWAPSGKELKLKFAAAVKVVDLAGKETALPAGEELTLARRPVFILDVPASLVQQAQANAGKPYPWGGDYSRAKVVTCKLGVTNIEDGLIQKKLETTTVVNDLVESWRRPNFKNPALHGEGHYVYFRTDPKFAPFGITTLEVTAVVRRLAADKPAAVDLCYESLKGYRQAGGRYTIPADEQWHEATWKLTDANFVGQWGFNFRLDALASPNEFLIKEVRVGKP